jgi:hypothetical protein
MNILKKSRSAVLICILAASIIAAFSIPAMLFDGADGTAVSSVYAQSRSGWYKSHSVWYYYSKGHKVTGLKSIKGKYYYFNNKGQMNSGWKKVGGYSYYFKKLKTGKAPAVVNAAVRIGAKKYYLSGKGRASLYVHDSATSKAIGKMIDRTSFKSTTSRASTLRQCYVAVLKYTRYYAGAETPAFTSGWQYKTGSGTINLGYGKCYGYASEVYLMAKALGYSPVLNVGKYYSGGPTTGREHAWVEIGNNILDPAFDDALDGLYNKNGTLEYFMVDKDQLQTAKSCRYEIISSYK